MEQLDDQRNLNDHLDTRLSPGQFRSSNRTKTREFSNSKICSFYSNYGFCKFGQHCKFLHRRKNNTYYNSAHKKPTSLRNDVSLKLPEKAEKNANASSKEYSNGATTHKNIQKRVCRYYKAGQCKKGENCLYDHNLDAYNFTKDVALTKNRKDHVTNGSSVTTFKKKSIPVCHYFRRGSCQKGEQCKYYHNPRYQREHPGTSFNIHENNLSGHQIDGNEDVFDQRNAECNSVISSQSDSINSENAEFNNVISSQSDINSENAEYNNVISSQSDINSENAECIIPSSELLCNHENSESLQESKYLNTDFAHDATISNHLKIGIRVPQNARIFSLATLSDDGLFQLRNTEITQLRKRFPKLKENDPSFTFDFEPTDPDWPFDMKLLHLQVTFPQSYPLEICDITVVSHMSYVPGILLRHLNQSICDWLIENHNAAIEQNQVVLLFRPFLKWFDKNLEKLFSFVLKKVEEEEGTENTDNELVITENNLLATSSEINPENDLSEQDSSSNNPDTQEDSEKEGNLSPSKQKMEPTFLNKSQMQGSKVLFTGLELVEGVATLSCKKLAVTLSCCRCKTTSNKILIPNKNTPIVCSKCSKSMECNFNPSLLHQFSNVLGTIYLMECQAVDINLVDCAFHVDCLSCSKQGSADGLHYGQKQKLWCKFCNQKLIIGIEGTKFQASASTTVSASNKTGAVKKVTKKKDPVIKEGCPLPDYGVCKHYKKSYRWLRFPCCGRLYPCDLCHDEKEDDHDMKYASRMVCGFCSKEQPYSKEKPCFGCSSNMTKKSGTYWEGGQGCRNSVTMSRKDAHKYAGMSKTLSKKSTPTGKKKK